MVKNTPFKYKPIYGEEFIKKFIDGLGKKAEQYFGSDKGCIIGLRDEGVFYGEALCQWLNNKKIEFTTMNDDGEGLEEEKLRGRRVLITENDIITGKAYKKVMEIIRQKKDRLGIKDIKFAALRDRLDLADFSVEGYNVFAPWSLNQIDGLDLEIIKSLVQDGRKPFVEIAKKTGLSPVGIKNRVEKLITQGVLRIQAGLRIETFNSVSAHISIEAEEKALNSLAERLEKSPLVYNLVKTSGSYNLVIDVVASNTTQIERLISKEIRENEGVKRIDVNIGELPVIPKIWNPPIV
ncbi:MAG: Lrp/AsnC family transcriptional regulator [Candidatus Pacebacteria bacterium]|nr:Lrp/AsnC family transcriptional regulator [Candidatus Paceibacterota bacterium]